MSALEPYDGPTRVGHWHRDDCDVYVGCEEKGDVNLLSEEAEPGDLGYYGNPFDYEEHGQEKAVRLFTEAFTTALEDDPELREAVWCLQGQTLGCHCRTLDEDGPVCHADVIARAADRVVVRRVPE